MSVSNDRLERIGSQIEFVNPSLLAALPVEPPTALGVILSPLYQEVHPQAYGLSPVFTIDRSLRLKRQKTYCCAPSTPGLLDRCGDAEYGIDFPTIRRAH